MTEKEIIEKLLKLKEIKPDSEWVALTKKQILAENAIEEKKSFSYFLFPVFFSRMRVVLGTGLALLLIFVTFNFSQNSLPGDFLYPVKKITEKAQSFFLPEKELSTVQLDLANKRLEELDKIAQNNQVEKIAPAINEFQSNISQASKNLAKLKAVNKEVVEKSVKLVEKKEKIEKVLGANIDTSEYENALKKLVESQINDLENRTLSDKQKEVLEKVKSDFEKGNYSQALEEILFLSQNSE